VVGERERSEGRSVRAVSGITEFYRVTNNDKKVAYQQKVHNECAKTYPKYL
jgi:hypothetical protein